MHHLTTVMILLMAATFATGIILPLTTPDRRRSGARRADPESPGAEGHDEVAAAELAVSR